MLTPVISSPCSSRASGVLHDRFTLIKAWFSDMDGTLFDGKLPPNPITAKALAGIAALLNTRQIPVVYISGRRISGIHAAIREHHLAMPAFIGASVGTAIFARTHDAWHEVTAYRDLLRERWIADARSTFDALMAKAGLESWRHTTSGHFRHTYRLPHRIEIDRVRQMMEERLTGQGLTTIRAIVSGPDRNDELHIDFVPDNGTKVHAARYIAGELLGLENLDAVLYTGDGGNDIDLLLAAGAAALVHTSECGLADKLSALRPDILLTPHHNIHGVLHAMEHFGMLRRDPA